MSDPHAAPAEPEPQTPMWLPALGAALFIAVGLWWAVTPSAPPISADTAASASAPAPSVAMTAANAPPPHAMPSGHPPAGAAQANPALEERMRKLREQVNMRNPAGHP